MASSASVYNYQRTVRQILKRHRKDPASFVLHIHQNLLRFEKQDGCFMFDSRTKDFLHYIRDQELPVDLIEVFEQAGVIFFEGCLVVEVHDHRKSPTSSDSSGRNDFTHSDQRPTVPMYLRDGGRYGTNSMNTLGSNNDQSHNTVSSPNGVEIYRVVLQPTAEALWSDLKTMDAKQGGLWSDQDALRIESTILNLTAPPLCLNPDPHAMRIANAMLSSTMPPHPYPFTPAFTPYRLDKTTKQKMNSVELELERSQDARREQIMSMMKDGWKSTPTNKAGNGDLVSDQPFAPQFSRINFIRDWRKSRAEMTNASPKDSAPSTKQSEPSSQASTTSSAKKRKSIKPKSGQKKAEATSVGENSVDKARGKTKRRKVDEIASPTPKTEQSQAMLYPGDNSAPVLRAQSLGQFSYGMPHALTGKLPAGEASLGKPNENPIPATNIMPNQAMLAGFGTPTLGLQAQPAPSFSPSQNPLGSMPNQSTKPTEQDLNGWMYK
ncbi:Transcription factor spt20 [Malassezia yamatoensis]|uniref:Transcription factor spt20 n=1 Tax=Malassezia yamatoensis TaxID=253288 RepID=A0AAJ5YPR4_9BASI|nr:Transcription factor spt20 [Malassezia yamatoensis]